MVYIRQEFESKNALIGLWCLQHLIKELFLRPFKTQVPEVLLAGWNKGI